MPSATDFAHGWTYNVTQNGTGAAAILTVPAADSGISRVLDSLSIAFANYGPGADIASVVEVTVAGAVALQTLLVAPATPGRDSSTFTDLNIASLPDGTIVIAFIAVAPLNYWQEITAQGHDIG